MTTPTLSEVICAHLAAARSASLPAAALERARIRVLDAVGAIAAGVRAAGSGEVVELVESWGGRPDATVLSTGTRVPAMHAALANAVLMRSYDVEPVGADRADGAQVPAHISGTTIPVALAVAESLGATGREFLTALVLGDDLAARLGHAVGFDVYGGGDNTGTINTLGGTATAALLMGLDADGIRRALGIAINQLGGTIDNINDRTLAFKLPIALSARNAIFSAELAATGFGGPTDPIGGRFGFLAQWSTDPDVERITAGLGEHYFADAVIKPWPTCRASQPALDATVQLVERLGLRFDDVERCDVHVTPRVRGGFVGQPFSIGDSPEVSGAFSLRFAVATALLDGTVRVSHLHESHLDSDRLRAALDRVELVDSLDPSAGGAAEVEVTLRDGTRHRQRVERALGDLAFTPLADDRIEAKFRDNVAWNGSIDEDATSRLSALARTIDDAPDVAELVAILANAPVRTPATPLTTR